MAGAIPVRWHPKMPGDEAGTWNARLREIVLSSDCSKPVQHQAFWHEWTHSVLDDVGVRLTPGQHEDVCNALALGMLCLQNAKWISFRRLPQGGSIEE